jgi:uncharacterized LabA/DUF88 family protein
MTHARVVVFIDYQNTYKRARECFLGEHAPMREGHVHPLALGNQLMKMDRRSAPSVLHQVRAYRGTPDARKDQTGNAASQRQADRWRKAGVIVTNRPLRYPKGWPNCPEKPEEKGIDVALAIDVVTMALRDYYDVGIIVSCDTDLRPAIEAVIDDTSKHIEVATWKPGHNHGQRLSVPGRSVWCNWLTIDHFNRCADTTDYGMPVAEGDGVSN